MISAVIFDLDGTLLETEELKALSYARAAAELRPDVPEEDVISAYSKDLVGHPRREVATTLVRRFGLEEAARERMADLGEEEPWRAYVRLRLDVYEALLEDTGLLLEKRYPHNIGLLKELKGEGYPAALATMSHRYQVERMLSVLDLEDAFDVVATVDDVDRGKPDPEIDLLVADRMGLPPGEFLVIEDSRAGVEAARAAGMAVVAVPTKLTGPQFERAEILDPRWVVRSPGELNGVVRERIEASGGGPAERAESYERGGSGG